MTFATEDEEGGGVGRDGGLENEGDDFSSSRIWDSERVESHGGGRILARLCFLRRMASKRGAGVR